MLFGASVPSRLSSSCDMSKSKPSNVLSRTFQFRDLTSALLRLYREGSRRWSRARGLRGEHVAQFGECVAAGYRNRHLAVFRAASSSMALGHQREPDLALPERRAGIRWNDPAGMPRLPDKLQRGARPDTLYRVTH